MQAAHPRRSGFAGSMNQPKVRIRQEVTAIRLSAKTVTVKNLKTGETYAENYDRLILSPGAEPIKPDIYGGDAAQTEEFITGAPAFYRSLTP